MTRFADRERARVMRKQGKSYSEIKAVLGVNKSTLSGWLKDMPLSQEQMHLLRDINPRRIESFRKTMQAKRDVRLKVALEKFTNDLGIFSERDLFIAGLYLYWGEGLKASRGTIGIANTDPSVIIAFLDWMRLIDKTAIFKVRLHLYKDMDIKKETKYWSKTLKLPTSSFRKPYIKTSNLTGLTYKNGYGHGTCNVFFTNIHLWEYITMGLKYVREMHIRP